LVEPCSRPAAALGRRARRADRVQRPGYVSRRRAARRLRTAVGFALHARSAAPRRSVGDDGRAGDSRPGAGRGPAAGRPAGLTP